jgi:uncharacterized protein YmfQ (DUF2313 family)
MSLDDLSRDRHLRRSGADYTHALSYLLPRGFAWPRDDDSVLMRTVRGLAQIWGSPGVEPVSDVAGTTQIVDARAGDLLETESDPRHTVELLPDWERNWGLPDPCFPSALSIPQRQSLLVMIMTLLGAQSRAFFQWASGWVGYTIHIKEFAPFMAGVSECGDTRYEYDDTGLYRWYIGPPEMRFAWTINADTAVLQWFRASQSQAGVDPHLRVILESPVACLLERWKPAHTEIFFEYPDLATGGPWLGTP